MEIKLSRKMLASIDEHIIQIRGAHSIIDVYKTAEIIRLKHISENVAREDIMDQLVLRACSNAVIEFNTSQYEFDDLAEIIDGAAVEFLMPVDGSKTAH